MSKARSETEDRCTVAQIQEFELLRSMYSPSELDFTHGNTDSNFLQHSALTLKLEVERESVDIEVRVPPLYPYGDFPVVFVRGKSDLIDNDAINRDLRRWIHSQEYGTPLIAQIASWVLDNYPFYLKISGSHMASNSSKAPTEYARLYILSHHLRSPVKRSDLLNLAKKLNLTGFSTPGKPAVIVVEGESKACEEFWKDVKSWTWKRISLRHSDVFSSPNDMKFTQFREVLSTGGANAMNDVKHILTDANLGEKFQILYTF
ncbi:hypothetical protein RB195_009930 [Necator americanus]|uniref:RWD domain-containing protein n=1 Tax=Necator americanus TaxID=51031 RepID=A0ABR1CVK4_NECAM